jgi:PhzF family phenazine biosynthesis protein
MPLPLYQIDAFTNRLFSGNPAAVCPLREWLSDALMQNIAAENNLAETAFYVKQGEHYVIRWFTPAVEVDLCGHATLAAAYVLFHHEGHAGDTIIFDSPRSGELIVKRNGDFITLDFPVDRVRPVEVTEEIRHCFNREPLFAFAGRSDYMLVFEHEEDILSMQPHLERIARLPVRGVIVTAPGKEVDFVSRFFAPQSGINEDPVTGSAHTTLTPYWSERLNKTELTAQQLSERGGSLKCRVAGERVEISGQGRLYLKGLLNVQP